MGLCACFLPLWGFLMFLMQPKLWRHLALPFLVAVVCTVVALYVLWEYVEVPQKLLLESWGLPLAASLVLSVVLIPAEAALINVLLFQLLFSKVPDYIRTEVLEDREVDKKLQRIYGVQDISGGGLMMNSVNAIFFLILQTVVMISAAPLHAVAGLGQVCWVASCGWVRTWDLLADVLTLIGYRSTWAQCNHILLHLVSYVGFGAVAFTLELVPFVNIIFIGGNAYGSALLFEGFVDDHERGPDPLPVPTNNGNENGLGRQVSRQPLVGRNDSRQRPASRNTSGDTQGSKGSKRRDEPQGCSCM